MSLASPSENFISQVCEAFRKAVERASGVTLEGREREFRRVLVRHLFDEVLGWNGHSKVGEIYDIACFDDEDFPIIIVETKWNVELTPEIKEKLRRRIEELGSVKYGIFASEREFIVYEYEDHKLREIAKVNVAEAVGVAKKEFGLSETGKKRILKLESLKRERLVWIEDPQYFEKNYKEISVAKREGVKLLTGNLKAIVSDLTTVLIDFFDSYLKRRAHYSGKFLESTFNDWLRISIKEEEFKKAKTEEARKRIIEVFCRETSYVIIGRLLFTRICEDKDIIQTMISSKGIAESLEYYGKRGVEDVYLRLFNDSRKEIGRYYSHLHELGFFDWWLIEEIRKGTLPHDDRNIQDNLEKDLDYSLKKAMKRLNRFNFAQVNRDILGDVYQGYLPPEERKRLGEFYTPKEVIDYILDSVGYKPEDEIRGKRILDPACGSGGFLVEATQRLVERYKKIGFDLNDSDDAKQIIEECVNSIYGLDIHPFACFIAEMNMLFQIVQLYDVVKQKHRNYKLPRIKVYATDTLIPPGEPVELTKFFENSRRRRLLEEMKGAHKIKKTSYHFVVGNPPYVNFANVIKRASSLELTETVEYYKTLIRRYRRLYTSAFWNFDIYFLFLEKSLDCLEDQGKLGFICSNQFIKRYYGKKLREFIQENSSVLHIVDFGDSGVFRDVTNYPCIVILEKNRHIEPFKCVRVNAPKSDLLNDIRSHLHLKRYEDKQYEIFSVSPSSLRTEGWLLAPFDEVELIEKIQNASKDKLDDFCQVVSGLRIGKDNLFIVQQTRTIDDLLVEICPIRYAKENKTFIVERELLKPILKGENVRRWSILWQDLFVIFPHKEKDGNFVSIKESILKDKYPYTYKYFVANQVDLENRSHWGKGPVEWHGVWYAIMHPGKPEYYKAARILTPALTDTNNFSLSTTEQYFVGGTAGVIGIIPEEKKHALLILGLLNSKILEFYLKQRTPIKSGGYFQFSRGILESLPMKIPQNDVENAMVVEIENLVGKVIESSDENISLRKKLQQFPSSYFEDDLIFDKLANIAKMHLTKNSYKISEKTVRTYPFKELEHPFRDVSRILLATDDYIDFYSEETASYVLLVLKTSNTITKRELLELKIPQKSHLKNLLNQYRKDMEQIVKNEKAVKELEKQIDDSVYTLYDITYKERRIIEEHLAKF